jgi:hypothetical protein
MKKVILASALGSCVALLATLSDVGTSRADTLRVAGLPTGTMTQFPAAKAPERIPGGSKVPGFFPARPKESGKQGMPSFIMVFTDDKSARDVSEGRGFGGFGNGPMDECFSERAVDVDIDQEGGPAEWSPSLQPMVQLAPHFQSAEMRRQMGRTAPSDVTPVHRERFVSEGAEVRIETVDAWVDPVTLGVRLIGRGSLPLKKIGEAPGDITIYAAQERTHVQLVVRRHAKADDKPVDPTDFSSPEAVMRQHERQMPLVIHNSSGATESSGCGFARVTLHAEKGIGEMARVETAVVSVNPPEEQPKKKDSPLAALLGNGNAAVDLTRPEVRVRPMSINLSSTWLTHDAEPVVSVTMGWAGRDRKM